VGPSGKGLKGELKGEFEKKKVETILRELQWGSHTVGFGCEPVRVIGKEVGLRTLRAPGGRGLPGSEELFEKWRVRPLLPKTAAPAWKRNKDFVRKGAGHGWRGRHRKREGGGPL